jgi:uncharacterized protein (DUF433 family)
MRAIMTASPRPKPLPVRMVPGILYSPLAKRARIQGTGLEVWEIVRAYHSVDRDFDRLAESFDWLTSDQLHAALRFAELNPDFIAARLAREAEAPRRLAELWEHAPDTKPPHLR